MPRTVGDKLQFLSQCDPTRLLDKRGDKIGESTPPISAVQFQGGSQAIDFDGDWLALIHEVRRKPGDRRRLYLHRFVWFDEAGMLRGVSREFFFHVKGAEFAAGMAWHPDNGHLLISYGVADKKAWIATVDPEDVRRLLETDSPALDRRCPGDTSGLADLPRSAMRRHGAAESGVSRLASS